MPAKTRPSSVTSTVTSAVDSSRPPGTTTAAWARVDVVQLASVARANVAPTRPSEVVIDTEAAKHSSAAAKLEP